MSTTTPESGDPAHFGKKQVIASIVTIFAPVLVYAVILSMLGDYDTVVEAIAIAPVA